MAVHSVYEVSLNYTNYAMSAPTAESDHPEWLNKALFKGIVGGHYTHSKIVGFSVKGASGNGENFCSVLYRVSIKVENNTDGFAQHCFMVKVNHETDVGIRVAKMLQVFPKEIRMYKELLPAFEKYFAVIGETLQIGPK